MSVAPEFHEDPTVVFPPSPPASGVLRYGSPPPPVRRKRRVFWWFFLFVQLIFIAWLVGAIVGVHASGGITAYCAKQGGGPSAIHACSDAADTGAGLGFLAIFAAWGFTDVMLAAIYGVYRLARRPNR